MPPIQATEEVPFDFRDDAELSPAGRQAKPLYYSSGDSVRRIQPTSTAPRPAGLSLEIADNDDSREDVESSNEPSPRSTADWPPRQSPLNSSSTAAKIQAIKLQRMKLKTLEGIEYNIIHEEEQPKSLATPTWSGLVNKLKDKNTELQKELYAAKEVTGHLRAELAEATRALTKPREQSPSTENHDIEITILTETFKSELNAHKREIAELKEKLVNAEATSKVLVANAVDYKERDVQRRHTSTGMEKVLSDKIAVVNRQLTEMAREKDKLEASLRSEITAAHEQANASANVTNQYIHRVHTLEHELRKANESCEALVAKVDNLEYERNSQTYKISHLNQKFANLSKDKEELESSLRSEISSLTGQKQDLQRQLQESQESSAKTIRKLNLQHAKLKAVHDETLKAQEEEKVASKAREVKTKAQELFLMGEVKNLKETLGQMEVQAEETATVYAHRIKFLTDDRNHLKENEELLVAKLAKVAKALDYLTSQQSDVFERASKQQEVVMEETTTQDKIIDDVKAEYKELERQKQEREILATKLRRIEEQIVERQKDRELTIRDALSQSKTIQRAQKERLRLMEEVLDHRGKISELIVKELTELPEGIANPELLDQIKERAATQAKELDYSGAIAEEPAGSIDLYEDIESVSVDSNQEDISEDREEQEHAFDEEEELDLLDKLEDNGATTQAKELDYSGAIAEEPAGSIDLYENIESVSGDSNQEDNSEDREEQEHAFDDEEEELDVLDKLEDNAMVQYGAGGHGFFGIFG